MCCPIPFLSLSFRLFPGRPILLLAACCILLAAASAPAGAWVINEIHADPHPTQGDANGDGETDVRDDEFVELVNTSGADADIGGWTLDDSGRVRHVFPAGTVVRDGCAVVVFAGGRPWGGFGNAIVQSASKGALGLNNNGDEVILHDGSGRVARAVYGAEGGSNQSLTLDPDVTGSRYVKHQLAAGASGRRYSPGTRVDGTDFGSCGALSPLEIYEIQGPGAASPYQGQVVTTRSNVVTALGPEGFFIQTPRRRDDADPDTSNGLYVFTEQAPEVTVGDLVDVTGRVEEYYGFTQLTGAPEVTLVGTAALPAPVVFDASTPSGDPTAPGCALEPECYEGMLITLAEGTVSGPNLTFGSDRLAELAVVAQRSRAYREPGIEHEHAEEDLPETIPIWDGNPEVFELDPDKLGLPNRSLGAGSKVRATGVLGFEYGDYELWPTELTVSRRSRLPRPVRPRDAGEVTVGSLNLYRLFDDVGDAANASPENRVSSTEYSRRRAKLVRYILEVLDAPDVLAVQEAENLAVLEDLAADLAVADPGVVYTAYLEEGHDVGGIDVGFLVRDVWSINAVTQLGAGEIFSFPGREDSWLHDRPPLLLEVTLEGASFDLAVLGRPQSFLERHRASRRPRAPEAVGAGAIDRAHGAGLPERPSGRRPDGRR